MRNRLSSLLLGFELFISWKIRFGAFRLKFSNAYLIIFQPFVLKTDFLANGEEGNALAIEAELKNFHLGG